MELFTAPIDALLGCGGEAGLWVMSANPDFWTAFLASMAVVRLLRSSDGKWANLLCGALERLLLPEPRVARQHYPERVVWMSRDATLDTAAGINLADKQYFVFDDPPVIPPFKRNGNEEVIIGECELRATLIITLLWGMEGGPSRILIVCADDLNVFEWLKSWKAKTGCANRMLKALSDYLIEHGIGITTRYVRSGHNFACD